ATHLSRNPYSRTDKHPSTNEAVRLVLGTASYFSSQLPEPSYRRKSLLRAEGPALHLDPATLKGIEGLLAQSFPCIAPLGSAIPTRPKDLREYPTWFIRGMTSAYSHTVARWSRAVCMERMDWASWELARSTLDESIKNSVGLLLFIDKMRKLGADPIG